MCAAGRIGRYTEVARKMTEHECVSYVACAIGETDVSVQMLGRQHR